MIFEGTAHTFGRDVDTDVIIPARYLNTSDPAELGTHCMEDIDADFVARVRPGDIIVAGENFGCGSSREHAPGGHQGGGRVVCRGRLVRPHLLPQRDQHRPADRGLPGGGPRSARRRPAARRRRSPASSRTSPRARATRPTRSPPFMRELIAQGGLLPFVKARLEAEGAA